MKILEDNTIILINGKTIHVQNARRVSQGDGFNGWEVKDTYGYEYFIPYSSILYVQY